MHFVYIIVSVPHPDHYYVGLTENVRQRVGHHNQGIVRSTAPFRPWRLRTAICFSLAPSAFCHSSSGNRQ
ncbi:MAG: GIY-YIG nuclease family protein [Verrucomicrobia bacterium]|nr:GIY-YIG nuclease family protein [Verrucomicrobiota bacterium]MBV8485097.1 GIY-YIG nuclease family protein [Verrucomicrobiota bacterium]